MKELNDLQVGDTVAVIRGNFTSHLTVLRMYYKAKVIKVSKTQITVEIANENPHKYRKSNGYLIGKSIYSPANFIEPWDHDKHQPLWEKCWLTIKTIRCKDILLDKIQSLECETKTLDEQIEVLSLMETIDKLVSEYIKNKNGGG